MKSLGTKPIDIFLKDVPKYLQAGDLFVDMSAEHDDVPISVPSNVIKETTCIDNKMDELRHLLNSMRFWIVKDVSMHIREMVIDCVLTHYPSDEIFVLLDEFENTFPFLYALRVLLTTEVNNFEDKFNPLPLVQYVLRRHVCTAAILTHLSGHQCVQTYSCGIEKGKTATEFLRQYSIHSVIEEDALDLLTVLYEQNISTTSLCYHSAKNGHLNCLKYLQSRDSHIQKKTSLIAATNGHVHILEYLNEKHCPFDHLCCRHAAMNGQLNCLKYLHSIGKPWGVYVPSQAALYGHLDCLKFAHENGCSWDASTCCDAASGGHLECLQYAHTHGCPWDNRTTTCAVLHLPCLQYALTNDCPYLTSIAVAAFRAGVDESGFYLLQHCTRLDSDICTHAATAGRVDIMEAIVRANIPWHPNTCSTAAALGHQECLDFALAHGAPRIGDLTVGNPDADFNALIIEMESHYFS